MMRMKAATAVFLILGLMMAGFVILPPEPARATPVNMPATLVENEDYVIQDSSGDNFDRTVYEWKLPNDPDWISFRIYLDKFVDLNDGNLSYVLNNISATFYRGSGNDAFFTMEYVEPLDTAYGFWSHHENPTLEGEYDWRIVVNDINDPENNVTINGIYTVRPAVNAPPDIATISMNEDETLVINMTDKFTPSNVNVEISLSGNDYNDNWTVERIEDTLLWEITPPKDYYGSVNFRAFGYDDWYDPDDMHPIAESYDHWANGYKSIQLVVLPVNDLPAINEIIVGDTITQPEWTDVRELLDFTGVEGDYAWVAEVNFEEDQVDANFTLNVTDVETDDVNLTYEVSSLAKDYDIELTEWNGMPCRYNISLEENVNGFFLANISITDDDPTPGTSYVWTLFNITPVNDAPIGEFMDNIWNGDIFDEETGVEVNYSVSVSDVDDIRENLTINWYINGDLRQDWNQDFFKYSFSTEGIYNVSVTVTDGHSEQEIGYFFMNITTSTPPWTSEDVAIDFQESQDDVVFADMDIDLATMDYSFSNIRKGDKPGIDIIDITSLIFEENLIITMSLAGPPIEAGDIDPTNIPNEFTSALYRIYFVKEGFSEPEMDPSSPNLFYEISESQYYPVGGGLSSGYLSYGEFFDIGDPVVEGNSIKFTISLTELVNAGITPEDFQVFAQAIYTDVSLSGSTAGYDSEGYNASTYKGGSSSVGGGEEDSLLWLWILIVVIIVLIVAVVVVFLIIKNKKKDGTTEESKESEDSTESETEQDESLVSDQTVPQETPQQQTVPQQQVPQTTVPQQQVPQTTVPQQQVPQTTVPQQQVPQQQVTQTTVPQQQVPQQQVPQTTVPQQQVPQTTAPQQQVPQQPQ